MEQQVIFAIPQSSRVSGNLNLDFLPVINESNILYVNSMPYAKLFIIGKGGSCKVYCTLTKECSVVAIKNIELDGMNKRVIDDYTNEKSLLKILRGSPAIIQMYDS
eukprot:11217652-Ditylum_brightwellii.AAC.1